MTLAKVFLLKESSLFGREDRPLVHAMDTPWKSGRSGHKPSLFFCLDWREDALDRLDMANMGTGVHMNAQALVQRKHLP